MLLYIIRHGQPDYATDTLTENGWMQARAVANRLRLSGIDEIHSSPMGRARQTAEPLSQLLGLPVQIEPWAYELTDESRTTFPDGVRKSISGVDPAVMHAPEYRHITDEEAAQQVEAIRLSGFPERQKELNAGLDGFLSRLGYDRHSDGFYYPTAPNEKHIALFCHAGMMRVLLSHMLHVPFHIFASTLLTQYTGVTLLHFPVERQSDEPISPDLFSYGDIGHLYAIGMERVPHYSRKMSY